MNRKRVLWPLLLAAAFALGVLVAQVQAADIFLPLVAKASTGPTSSGTGTVENVHYHASKNCFYGELVNETPIAVRAPTVRMYLLNADGHSVLEGTGYFMAPILLPGERTPFRVCWSGSLPAWHSYVIYPQSYPTDRLPVDCAFSPVTHGPGWTVTITVTNSLPVHVSGLVVGTVLYGPSGEVIGYRYLWEGLGPLAPGETSVIAQNIMHWDWASDSYPVSCAGFSVLSGEYDLELMNEGDNQEGEREP